MGLTQSKMLDRQRRYAKTHQDCVHIIQCAITPQDREAAVEMMRSGTFPAAALGAAMLSGPCVTKGSE